MNKYFFTVILVFISVQGAFGQHFQDGRPPRPNKQQMERIHAAKMAYITDRLRLSEEQSSRFVPLYNDYDAHLVELRKSFRQSIEKNNQTENMTNEQAMDMIDNNLDYQEQVIKLKRDYNERFLKIISPQQLSNLRIAEREFRQTLMQKLHDKQMQRDHRSGNNWDRQNFNHNSEGNRY